MIHEISLRIIHKCLRLLRVYARILTDYTDTSSGEESTEITQSQLSNPLLPLRLRPFSQRPFQFLFLDIDKSELLESSHMLISRTIVQPIK